MKVRFVKLKPRRRLRIYHNWFKCLECGHEFTIVQEHGERLAYDSGIGYYFKFGRYLTCPECGSMRIGLKERKRIFKYEKVKE